MLITRISSKGQLIIPKPIREKLNIEPGTYLTIQIDKQDIILRPMKETPLDRLSNRFDGEKILDELEREHAKELDREDRA